MGDGTAASECRPTVRQRFSPIPLVYTRIPPPATVAENPDYWAATAAGSYAWQRWCQRGLDLGHRRRWWQCLGSLHRIGLRGRQGRKRPLLGVGAAAAPGSVPATAATVATAAFCPASADRAARWRNQRHRRNGRGTRLFFSGSAVPGGATAWLGKVSSTEKRQGGWLARQAASTSEVSAVTALVGENHGVPEVFSGNGGVGGLGGTKCRRRAKAASAGLFFGT